MQEIKLKKKKKNHNELQNCPHFLSKHNLWWMFDLCGGGEEASPGDYTYIHTYSPSLPQHHSTTTIQFLTTTAPQPYSPSPPQHHSTTTIQFFTTTAPQHHNHTVLHYHSTTSQPCSPSLLQHHNTTTIQSFTTTAPQPMRLR